MLSRRSFFISMKHNRNHLFFSIVGIFCMNVWSQNFSIDPKSISNTGNIELLRQIDLNKEIDNSPYLVDQYQYGEISTPNLQSVQISARLHMGESYFEIVGTNGDVLKYTPSGNTKVILGDKEYITLRMNPINAPGKVMLVEKAISEAPYGLYINRRKNLEYPREDGIAMPSSGFSNPKNPKWVESSEYYIYREGMIYLLNSNLKRIFNSELLLPQHRNPKKLRLRKESDIVEWINELNKS